MAWMNPNENGPKSRILLKKEIYSAKTGNNLEQE